MIDFLILFRIYKKLSFFHLSDTSIFFLSFSIIMKPGASYYWKIEINWKVLIKTKRNWKELKTIFSCDLPLVWNRFTKAEVEGILWSPEITVTILLKRHHAHLKATIPIPIPFFHMQGIREGNPSYSHRFVINEGHLLLIRINLPVFILY